MSESDAADSHRIYRIVLPVLPGGGAESGEGAGVAGAGAVAEAAGSAAAATLVDTSEMRRLLPPRAQMPAVTRVPSVEYPAGHPHQVKDSRAQAVAPTPLERQPFQAPGCGETWGPSSRGGRGANVGSGSPPGNHATRSCNSCWGGPLPLLSLLHPTKKRTGAA